MIRINLVPKEVLAKARQLQRLRQVAIAASAAGVLIAGVSLIYWARYETLEARLARDNARFKVLSDKVAKVEEIKKESSDLRLRLKVISDLMHTRPLFPAFMADFVRSVPAAIQVQKLDTKGASGTSAPISISVTAVATSNEAIAAWMNGMQDSAKFSNLELGGVSQQGSGASAVYGFSLTGVYKPSF